MMKIKAHLKVIDLSHIVTNGMPVFPGTDPVSIKPLARMKSEGFNEKMLNIPTHTGTHIDCALHIINNGFDTGIPAERFVGKGIILDCRNIRGEIPVELCRKQEVSIRNSEFLILYTGISSLWGKPDYFGDFPVLSAEAAHFISGLNLKGTGIDAPSFDPVNSIALTNHHTLLSAGMVLIENLTNLEELFPFPEFIFSCLPLKIEKGDGSPVRAVGIIP